MKKLRRLKMMLPSTKTVGVGLLCVALCVAIMPIQIFSRGHDPSTRLYRDSKGSWVPAAEAWSHRAVFFMAAGVFGISGILFLSHSAASDRRRRRDLQKTKSVSAKGLCERDTPDKLPGSLHSAMTHRNSTGQRLVVTRRPDRSTGEQDNTRNPQQT
jgi:hypothetical protein